jgi:hypothetical protein
MDNQKEIIDLALERMAGFQLQGSSYGDNRSIFSLIQALIESADGQRIADYRRPLMFVLEKQVRDPKKDRFLGCKLALVQKTITTIFGDQRNLCEDKRFVQWSREKLLLYLETCKRIFMSSYVPTVDRGLVIPASWHRKERRK